MAGDNISGRIDIAAADAAGIRDLQAAGAALYQAS